jgi:hypothetical protein
MTKQELNKAIKKLFRNWRIASEDSKSDIKHYFESVEPNMKKEYQRLYFADSKFEYISRDNILRMIILNRRHRVIPFHQFATQVNEDEL